MRRLLFLSLLLVCVSVMWGQIKRPPIPGYVDLDLPSGTYWKTSNEGLFTMAEAIKMYGNQIPTNAQTIELQSYCTWTWEGDGYRVTGKNGNSIFLPAAGYYDCDGYLKKSGSEGMYMHRDGSLDAKYAVGFSFTATGKGGYMAPRCNAISVHLVK